MSKIFKIIFCFALLATAAFAQSSQEWQLSPKSSQVNFLIQSTLHQVHGQAREVFGSFEQDQNLIKGFVDVGVLGLTTNDKARDNNMYQMFNASQYAQIHFSFKNTDLARVIEQGDGPIVFLGNMTMHGITKPATILTNSRMDKSTLVCEGRLLINLKDYDLKPPSVLGIIRVKDEVLVEFRLVFSKNGNPNAS